MNIAKNVVRIFSAALLIVSVFAFSAKAQSYTDLIKENPERASGIYHYYEGSSSLATPAPKGYKPFYISHYGRHGSRYHSRSSFFKEAIGGLEAALEAGILSEEGSLLLRQMDTLYGEHQGMFGMLTKRGEEEQRGIGRRMYANYSKLFKGKDGRTQVNCVSSYWPRCLVSMAGCTAGIQENSDGMDFHYVTGPKYLDYISMDLDTKKMSGRYSEFSKRLGNGGVSYERFFGAIFTDTDKALEIISNPDKFMKSVYDSGAVSPNTDAKPDIFSHFTAEELAGEWIVSNDKMYYRYGISAEEGDYVSAIAKPLIEDIVAKADAAVKDGSSTAADLRFGHDVGLLPLIGTIGIKGMEKRFNSEDVHTHWFSFRMIPMASNLQMVFYRNKKDDILVKLVYNEEETSLPALKSFNGPYYKWQDLREYLVETAEAIPDCGIAKDDAEEERTGVSEL